MSKDTDYGTIATLGQTGVPITCSMNVATKIRRSERVFGFSSFEDAAQSVITGKDNALLVPNAYVGIPNFFMSDKLVVVDSFISKIPSLILCSADESIPDDPNTIFLHPSTKSLLDPQNLLNLEKNLRETILSIVKKGNLVFVRSNQEACEKLKETPKAAIAITNSICCEYFQLHSQAVLRVEENMSFSIFEKK